MTTRMWCSTLSRCLAAQPHQYGQCLNPGQLITITPGGSAWGGINWYNTAQARQVDRHNQAVSLVGFLMCKSATCKFHNGCILLNM